MADSTVLVRDDGLGDRGRYDGAVWAGFYEEVGAGKVGGDEGEGGGVGAGADRGVGEW